MNTIFFLITIFIMLVVTIIVYIFRLPMPQKKKIEIITFSIMMGIVLIGGVITIYYFDSIETFIVSKIS